MKTHPGEEIVNEEKFPNSRKPSHRWVCAEFWNLRGQHNQEEETPQNMCLTITPSREVAQTPVSTTSKWGLDGEAQVPFIG